MVAPLLLLPPPSVIPRRRMAVAAVAVAAARTKLSYRKRRIVVAAAAAGGGDKDSSPYFILGVSQGASNKEIKRAYRRLALKFHPDVNKEPDAEHKFMRIKQAYQTLIDPSNRAKFEASKRKQASSDDEFYGLGDFFRDLQAEFDKKSASSSSAPKSLWEELADIGEEFLDFLEKELNVQDEDEQVKQEAASPKEESSNTGQQEEIEDMLEQLKRELGLQ